MHSCIDQEGWACINAEIYGPCTSETCEGICSYKGDCTCLCGHPPVEDDEMLIEGDE